MVSVASPFRSKQDVSFAMPINGARPKQCTCPPVTMPHVASRPDEIDPGVPPTNASGGGGVPPPPPTTPPEPATTTIFAYPRTLFTRTAMSAVPGPTAVTFPF